MIQLYQTLDLRPIGIPQTLRLSQYDSDFEIIFELTNFDGTWILDTNTTAEVQGTKTDGHGYSADAVFDDQLKTVTIAGDVQMTAAAGRNTFEVVLFHDGDRLGSKNFILDVERAALDAETTASDSKIKNFTAMVEAAEDAAETATAAAEAAEQAAARGGLSEEAKAALLAVFRNVAWINDQGQDYYDALEDALADSSKTLTSISAVFDAGGNTIYTDDTLDSLKQYTTVTAHYSDETSATVTAYTLTGTLTEGTGSLTATYEGLTATVTVPNVVDFYNITEWSTSNGLLNIISSQAGNYGGTCGYEERPNGVTYPRKGAWAKRGMHSAYNSTKQEMDSSNYPIPIPINAQNVTVNIANYNDAYFSFAIWKLNNTKTAYSRISDSGWKANGSTITLSDIDENMFATITIKNGSAGTSGFNDDPNVTIQYA